MSSRSRSKSLAAICAVVLASMGAGCQAAKPQDPRLNELTNSLQQIEGRLDGFAEDSDAEALKTSLADLRVAFDALKADVEKSQVGDDALLTKIKDVSAKLDSVSAKVDGANAKIAALEKRLLLLEARFNDHVDPKRHPT